jgi:hypothetical protein
MAWPCSGCCRNSVRFHSIVSVGSERLPAKTMTRKAGLRHRQLAISRAMAMTLVSVFVSQGDEHGASDDLHIQPKTPVVSVIQIILKPVRD